MKILNLGLVLFLVWTLPGQADVPESTREGLPLGVQWLSFFYGPAMGNPGAGEVPTTWMDSPSGVSVQNQLGVRYDFNDNISIMPVFDFEVLVTDPARVLGDRYLGLTYDSFIKASFTDIKTWELGPHDAALHADVRLFVPTGGFSRDNNMLGSVRASIVPTLQFAHSGLSVALVSFARYWLNRQDHETFNPNNPLPQIMFYTGPVVNYQVNDRISVWGLAEASMTYDTKGNSNVSNPNRSLVDFEPGMDFRVGNNITISPYLNWYVRQPMGTTSVNVTANFTI